MQCLTSIPNKRNSWHMQPLTSKFIHCRGKESVLRLILSKISFVYTRKMAKGYQFLENLPSFDNGFGGGGTNSKSPNNRGLDHSKTVSSKQFISRKINPELPLGFIPNHAVVFEIIFYLHSRLSLALLDHRKQF